MKILLISGGEIVFSVWLIFAISFIGLLLYRGKRALEIFPDIKTMEVLFREKSVSGTSLKNRLTKLTSVNNALDIIVTKNELWIKSPILLAGFLNWFGLLHKVSINNIYIG